MCKNNLKETLLSRYNDTYFKKLTEIQKKQGNRFLLSDCPKNAEDVRLLFLNLNPQMALADEEANKPCMNKFTFWFDEGWKGSQHFRNLFYVIGEKLKNPKWSYQENHHRIKWNELTSDKIYSKPILSAYAYPLRTRNEESLNQNTNAVQLSENLWKKILKLLPSRLKIVVTGNTPYDMICRLLNAEQTACVRTNRFYRGRPSTIKYAETDNRIKILRFPQVTLCPLIGYTGNVEGKGNNDYIQAVDDALNYIAG